MITQTPPRASVSTPRKRDRTAVAYNNGTPTASLSLSSVACGNAPSFHHGHHNMCQSPHHGISIGGIGAAATVSPFVDRLSTFTSTGAANLLKLEPVPEETNEEINYFNFSQSSTTSSLTLGSNNNNGNASFLKMDLSSGSGDEGGGGSSNAMIGAMVGGSIPSDSYTTAFRGFHPLHYDAEFSPPTKRARLDSGPMDVMTFEETPTSNKASFCSPMKKMNVNHCISFKSQMNIDKCGGKMCCHVCSLEDSAKKSTGRDASDVATTPPLIVHHYGHNVKATSSAPAPRSHSLLAYFRPTKKQPASHTKSQTLNNSEHIHSESQRGLAQHDIPSSNLSPCLYCDKPACNTCTRQCELCLHRFCSFCTKVDYESSVVERVLCFDCDNEFKATGGSDNVSGDCDMMDL